jgi:hypothetical protein
MGSSASTLRVIGARLLAEIVAIFADNRQLSMAHFRSVQEPLAKSKTTVRSNTRRSYDSSARAHMRSSGEERLPSLKVWLQCRLVVHRGVILLTGPIPSDLTHASLSSLIDFVCRLRSKSVWPSIDAYLRAHLEWLGGSRAKES